MTHRISLIIPTLNRDSLSLLKEAIAHQTLAPDEFIIIEDKERKGSGWARNRGIEQATGDLLVFTDDDCIPTANWIEELVQALTTFQGDVVGGTMNESDPYLHEFRMTKRFPMTTQIDEEGFVASTCNILYKKSFLEKCKEKDGYYFNEKFIISQDKELALRVRALGARFVFVANHPKHLKKVNFWSYQRLMYNRGMGIGMLHEASLQKKNPLKPVQKSMVWGKSSKKGWKKWLYVFFQKTIGPFDRKSFSSNRYFFRYWVGEKTKAIGYIMTRIFKVA